MLLEIVDDIAHASNPLNGVQQLRNLVHQDGASESDEAVDNVHVNRAWV
jgi:hypothetical protein